MFKKILNKLKAEKINGSAKPLVDSSKNLTNALEFIRNKQEHPREKSIIYTLELAREYGQYSTQKRING